MNVWRHVGSVKNRLTGLLRLKSDHRDNIRILYGAAALAGLLILLWITLNLVSVKKVELVVEGSSETIKTRVANVEQLLAEQGITVGEDDLISVPLTDKVKDHSRIEVTYAKPVTVLFDSQTVELRTTARTVQEVLQEAGVHVGEEDIVQPGILKRIDPNETIRVARIEKLVETETEMLPYEIVTRQDPTLSKGKETTLQEGMPGLIEHTYERVYEDGRLVEEQLLASDLRRASKDKIVAVGTRSEVAVLSAASPDVKTVTKDGVTFGVKKVIEATLTAYDAGLKSTGKTEDHPHYGITYTGTTVKEGRTAAVDPKVIPFGWWIYVEGYGFRRAEDKGGGVKGNWVDIYFDSYEDAENFGRKKGTVYIIGPTHPHDE